jgi:hypothetical protein
MGEWKVNQMNGFGKFIWKEGKKYYGFYQFDKKNGFGIYFWPNDKFFIGFWKDGKQNGYGKYVKGNVIKFGLWNYGKKEKNFDEEEFFINVDKSVNEKKYIYYYKMDINEIKNFMEIY